MEILKTLNDDGRNRLVGVKLLDPRAKMPTKGSATAAAYDLYALENYTLHVGDCIPVRTGIALDLSHAPTMHALVLPRSGLGGKEGLILGNTIGLIDNDYQGEILNYMWLAPRNSTRGRFEIEAGMRIAQLYICQQPITPLVQVREFAVKTERGAGGFGSTGHA